MSEAPAFSGAHLAGARVDSSLDFGAAGSWSRIRGGSETRGATPDRPGGRSAPSAATGPAADGDGTRRDFPFEGGGARRPASRLAPYRGRQLRPLPGVHGVPGARSRSHSAHGPAQGGPMGSGAYSLFID